MLTRNIILIVVLASLLGGILSLFGYHFFLDEKGYETIESRQNARFTRLLADSSVVVPEGLNFIYAADAVTPAVVHIRTYYEVAGASNAPGSPFDDLLRDYFGDVAPMPGNPYGQRGPQEASGSGVILSEDGYIVTNNHVIDKADKIVVVLNDKRSYQAKLIGKDPTTDLALLKIEGKGFPFVEYGNSDKVQIGEWVLAVGNPFNLNSTVTAGIVSAKGRNINILHDKDNMAIESFIQTDAVVNPGNSGGALVNLRGNLIGINTAIASPTGSYTGYSFAVPVSLVKKVVDDLLRFGHVQRALLGVTILDINAEVAKEKGISDIRGVYIAGVGKGSAADKAGLKEGDIITQINGIDVNSSAKLQEIVARNRPGDKVKVTYLRNGKIKEVTAVLKNSIGNTEIVRRDDNAVRNLLGADLGKVSNEEMARLRLEGGAKVINLTRGKLQEAGIKEGFIITAVDKNRIGTPEDAAALLQKSKEGGTLIEGIYPNGQKAYYAIGW